MGVGIGVGVVVGGKARRGGREVGSGRRGRVRVVVGGSWLREGGKEERGCLDGCLLYGGFEGVVWLGRHMVERTFLRG